MQTKFTAAKSWQLRARSWLKRLGVAGFVFFLLKGLLWLLLPGLFAYLGFAG